ncbi:MAG: LPXTG cell wall anchor domain-containing protein [Acidimicrobiia bacterium]
MNLRRLAAAAAAAAAIAVPATLAGAQGYTVIDTGTVTDTTPAPGQPVTVTVTGLKPLTQVTVELRSDPILLGTFMTDANGTLNVSVTIPAGAPVGSHTIVATGLNAAGNPVTASIPVQVGGTPATTTPPGTGVTFLPRTGADLAAMLTVGGVLIVVGGSAVTAVRRRSAGADAV